MDHLINIRNAVRLDVHSIIRLAGQLSESVHIDQQHLIANFETHVVDDRYCLLVATVNENIVGYVSAFFHHAIYANGEVAYVDEIVVDRLHRDSKVGTELMLRFEEIAKKRRCILVSLATFGAKAFYEKLGYSSKAGYFKKYLV